MAQDVIWVDFHVEFDQTVFAKPVSSPLSNDEFLKRLTEALSRRFPDSKPVNKSDYEESPHHIITEGDFAFDYLAGIQFHAYSLYFFNSPGTTHMGFNMVAVRPKTKWEPFARDVFKLMRDAVPLGYRIVTYDISTYGVDHKFSLGTGFSLDAVALLLAAIIWLLVWVAIRSRLRNDMNGGFFLGIGGSAMHGFMVAILTLVLRRLVYRGVVYNNER